MVDVNKLKGVFREKGITIEQAASYAGISSSTMQRRLDSGVFGTDEIDKLISALKIKRPQEIFFVKKVN